MNYEYIDTHSHLNLSHFNADRDDIARLCAEKSVATITVGTDLADSKLAVELAEQHDNLYAIVGLHPTEVGNENFNTQEFESLLAHPKVVGIGECGLDYFRRGISSPDTGEVPEGRRGTLNNTPQSRSSLARQLPYIGEQKTAFHAQLDLAIKHDLPVMLHIRPSAGNMDAYHDVLSILRSCKEKYGDILRGQAHFFAGTPDIAQQFLDMGFYISCTGVITFTHDYDEVIRMIPNDRLLSETDTPFVAPVPYRGQRAEPWQVIEVVKKMAEIRGEKLEVIKKQLAENASRLWKVSKT